MPDSRRNRGPAPQDKALFSPENVRSMRRAVAELSWLLTRGYPPSASLKLVGDRHKLRARQRTAVARCACSDQDRASRLARRVMPEQLNQEPIEIDGFNLLTTLEAALAGGIVLIGRDRCHRDMAGVHGSWKRVNQTAQAIEIIGLSLSRIKAGSCLWLLDRPVSNSGKLAALLRETSRRFEWDWQVRCEADVDGLLRKSKSLVVSADSWILEAAQRWMDLAGWALHVWGEGFRQVDLAPEAPC